MTKGDHVHKLSEFNKTLTAVVTGGLGWGSVVVSSDASHVTASEWLALGVVMATALGVYAVANSSGTVNITARLRGHLPPEDDLPTTGAPERGAVDLATVNALCLVVITAVFVLWALGHVPK